MPEKPPSPPIKKSEVNPNEKILSSWELACHIASIENRIEKLKSIGGPSIMIEADEKNLKTLRAKTSPEAKEFLSEARVYQKARKERENSLLGSPFYKLVQSIEEESTKRSPEDDEVRETSSAYTSLDEFLKKTEKKFTKEDHINGGIFLQQILDDIYNEVMNFDFTSEENTTEREDELKTLPNLNAFVSTLNNVRERLEQPVAKTEGKDHYIQDVVDAIYGYGSGEKLIPNLALAFQKIIADLKTRKFGKIPKKPARVRSALNNLGRDKDAVN